MGHVDPSPHLGSLAFLVGRFRGEGRFRRGATSYSKDVVGRWEVGGHFLSLSMTASYRVEDRVADVHHALAIVGVERPGDAVAAHVFTDGGEVFEHRLLLQGDRITFRDRVPHETRARGARKTLVPTPYGYDETLELESEEDRFEVYSVVRLERLG